MNSNNDKKTERITVLAKDFTPAAMEFHRKNMSARGYRMEGTIVPRKKHKVLPLCFLKRTFVLKISKFPLKIKWFFD